MNKWIAEFDLEDGDTMPEHMDLNYMGAQIDFHCRPMWIPCSERLPEKQGQYYVSGGDKVWICDFLIFSNFKGGWCNNVSNPVVEAWMPLPEPYEKEGENE